MSPVEIVALAAVGALALIVAFLGGIFKTTPGGWPTVAGCLGVLAYVIAAAAAIWRGLLDLGLVGG